MKSLQLMIQTYRENPKFGDVKSFESELEVAVLRVQHLQASLHSLRSQLEEVSLALDNLKLGGGQITEDLSKKTVCEKNIQEVSGYDTNNKVSGETENNKTYLTVIHPEVGQITG